jgi:hypothetical protein
MPWLPFEGQPGIRLRQTRPLEAAVGLPLSSLGRRRNLIPPRPVQTHWFCQQTNRSLAAEIGSVLVLQPARFRTTKTRSRRRPR